MSFKKSFNSTANNLKNNETNNVKLVDQLNRFEHERNGCESLLEQPKLVDRFFSDSEMSDLTILIRFFRFLLQSMNASRQNGAKLIIRLPGSKLLEFSHSYLKYSSLNDKNQKDLLEKFVLILSKILQLLLELHPSCYQQLDSLGIFDRIEIYNQKISNEDIQTEVTTLISRVEELRIQHEKKIEKYKPEIETPLERDDPPPDDFHELSIYPTLNEIFQQQIPYLRKNITTGQYKNGTHYLDIHFRLLREDFLWPLREAICQYMSDDNRNVSFRNTNVRLYRNTILTGSICSQAGILFSLLIDLNSLPKTISWANSRRLIYGNLLAATFDDFDTSCFLLTVEDRSNIDKDGTLYVRCQKELCDYKLMKISPGTRFTLLETTSYFEAYRPILQALQNIKDDQIPLEKYLLQCDINVPLPNYFQQNSSIDFRPVLIKTSGECNEFDGDLSNVKDLSTWPNAQQLGLDESQYKALQLAITKSVALIQGPPGCGKTYLGVRLAELFYHNRARITGCERPILMICYTNHALDQFLSSIIQKLSLQPGEIVRVGGRSTHRQIEPYLIQKLRQQKRDIRSKNEELSTKYEILHNIKKQMDDCRIKYYQCSQQLLDINQLLHVIDRQQFLTLIEPILSKLDIFHRHWNTNKGGIYCCRLLESQESDEDSSDDSQSESENEDENENLSFYEKIQRMNNRIHCHKLNNLSDNDQQEINQLFIKWLDATPLQMILNKIKEQNEDNDGDDAFQEQRRKNKNKNKNKAKSVLEKILNDPILTTTTSNNTNIVDENPVNLEDDEEELRRLENVDNTYIPFTMPNQTNDKEYQKINIGQLEYMQHLLNNRTAFLSDNEIKNFKDLWSTSIDKEQRQALYRYWLRKYVQLLTDEWFHLNEQYDENYKSMQALWFTNDQIYMDKAFIIAMTTHCASRYQKVLKQIAPRICIVEEAAEVFESHIVTAIGERIEHLILIGDHVQLRPSPNVYTLAKHFNLDVSLFERLIKNQMPSVQLCVQHRSIPIISSLTHHFYDIPIINHESVNNRPSIIGITHPLYFINHGNFEENVSDGVSKRNPYESNYILQLADYLIKQGYDKNDITILTTYMGQRQQIQKSMNQLKHLKGIHVTVVDNFQGEENRIVLLSLVRSNADRRLGYIAVDNRICVALSRAQNGFYVIGNFHLLAEHNETWKIIINKMKQLKLIGSGLPINCPNHLDNQTLCIYPHDFNKRPLGGCGLKCEARLSCGHQCPLTCHNTSHNLINCQKLCLKNYDDCEHQCQKQCHSTTICLPCHEMIHLKMPNCEHTSDIACFMRKNNQLECGVLVPYKCSLGHQVQVRCCDLRNKELQGRLCTHPCDFILECGHNCKGTCSTCLQSRFHRPCDQQELIVYICGHSRQQRCHELGPPCEQQYMKLCDHPDEPRILPSQCLVYQCNRFCQYKCRHLRCGQRCKSECDRQPCNKKCTRRFDCEHYCNGICGEPCIDCLVCREKELPNEIQKIIRSKNIRYATFVQLECDHLFETNILDEYIEKFENQNFLSNDSMYVEYPRCPKCQHPIIKCKRYSRLIKKIQQRIGNSIFSLKTLSSSLTDGFGVNSRSVIQYTDLPEYIIKIIKINTDNNRRRKLTELFVHVVNLFRKLSDEISKECDVILKTIYEHVEKNDSLFLTRQQWLDLENEYNRLLIIDTMKESDKLLESDRNEINNETLNDILFGPNPFNQFACQICYLLLNNDNENNDKWKSILPDETKWEDFEQDRLICDGKWLVCAQKIHLMWNKTITEQTTCSRCNMENEPSSAFGLGRGKSNSSRGRFYRR
ncbi:unnamed protein product [Rotaria sordida]|uniref:NF-X1-type domain-containing protein n=1 Tax=Rotaria sordida TaxID=392033 RepID=A0A818VIX5_9BILA|nr:unnamed protein product [Rotaria sordida]